MKIISLFSGAGGMDLGFKNAGFDVVWANEFDRTIWDTYLKNHTGQLDTRSITKISSEDIPDTEGIIGGPPCQSWSLAGSMKGIADERGKLVYEYVRILKDKNPKFFVFENVPGLLSKTHFGEFQKLVEIFKEIGYKISFKLLNAKDYGIPQTRKRVFVVGIRSDFNTTFDFLALKEKPLSTLSDAIYDLESVENTTDIKNHEYFEGTFSSIYMSRNRRRDWAEPSFTIQASGRHAPLHPSSSAMKKIGKDQMIFEEDFVRRLSVRECARIQTFPDTFEFIYKKIDTGYKMVGNAVPVKLAEIIAGEIKKIFEDMQT